MKLPLTEAFIRSIIGTDLELVVIRALDEEIYRRQTAFKDREAFFESLSSVPGSAKGHWSRAVKKLKKASAPKDVQDTRRIVAADSLVKFIRLLKPTIEIDIQMEPWNRWRAGSRVIVFVGERDVSIPIVSKNTMQRAVGARDSQAFAELAKLLYRDIGLDCEVVLEHVPALPKGQYARFLQDKLAETDVGMVVVLGSPVVNPLANPAAQEVFRDTDQSFMPKFRWAYRTKPCNTMADCDIPHKQEKWLPAEEGVSLAHHRNLPTPYPRVGDDLVIEQMASGETEFTDAGIFMMDCSRPQGAILLLCAGHGGCGTLGCVAQLRDRELIGDLLDLSRKRKAKPADTKPGRIVGVVTVNRQKKKRAGSDKATEANARGGAADDARVDDLEIVSSKMAWASVPAREWS